MVAINPTIQIITLKVSGLNTPIKRQTDSMDRKTICNYMLYIINPTLNIKTQL